MHSSLAFSVINYKEKRQKYNQAIGYTLPVRPRLHYFDLLCSLLCNFDLLWSYYAFVVELVVTFLYNKSK